MCAEQFLLLWLRGGHCGRGSRRGDKCTEPLEDTSEGAPLWSEYEQRALANTAGCVPRSGTAAGEAGLCGTGQIAGLGRV